VKRKGKPKGPAPGFHLPRVLWDDAQLPPIRPKDSQGLPQEKAGGLILFRFHVDPKVIAAYPEWSSDLYDNPPIPEGDNLLPSLGDVMASTVYQHLRPAVKALRDLHDVPTMTAEQIEAVLAQPDEEIQPVLGPIFEDMFKAEPTADLQMSSDSLDLSLDSLVNMSDNSYLNHTFSNRMESSEMPEGPPAEWKPAPGTSVSARKMGKRMAMMPPGGAAIPVPKRSKGDSSAIGEELYEETSREVDLDTGFLDGL
jgi:hypothetical protein